MRKKDESLYEKLLACAQGIVDEQGAGSLSIRALSERAGVATGTVYNYFEDKGEILLALTEGFWRQALDQMESAICQGSFVERLEAMYAFLRGRVQRLGGDMMSNLSTSSGQGRERMAKMLKALANLVEGWLWQDGAVRPDVWDQAFTRERYALFVVENIVSRLRTGRPDAGFLMEMVKRTLY